MKNIYFIIVLFSTHCFSQNYYYKSPQQIGGSHNTQNIYYGDSDKIRSNNGILTPSKIKSNKIIWNIGGKDFIFNSDSINIQDVLKGDGIRGDGVKIATKPFDGVDFLCHVEDGKLKVSSKIRDSSGNIIAELINNEWEVNRPQFAYERNFNDTSLEVKDNHGDIVFQIEISNNRITLNSKFVKPDGELIIAFPLKNKTDSLPAMAGFINMPPGYYKWASVQTVTKFHPLFKYPSALHLGEREAPIFLNDKQLWDNVPYYPGCDPADNRFYFMISH